jgi:hypothetical protein
MPPNNVPHSRGRPAFAAAAALALTLLAGAARADMVVQSAVRATGQPVGATLPSAGYTLPHSVTAFIGGVTDGPKNNNQTTAGFFDPSDLVAQVTVDSDRATGTGRLLSFLPTFGTGTTSIEASGLANSAVTDNPPPSVEAGATAGSFIQFLFGFTPTSGIRTVQLLGSLDYAETDAGTAPTGMALAFFQLFDVTTNSVVFERSLGRVTNSPVILDSSFNLDASHVYRLTASADIDLRTTSGTTYTGSSQFSFTLTEQESVIPAPGGLPLALIAAAVLGVRLRRRRTV